MRQIINLVLESVALHVDSEIQEFLNKWDKIGKKLNESECLDKWGFWIGLERKEKESNGDFRERLESKRRVANTYK